jgi:hypothetical protein
MQHKSHPTQVMYYTAAITRPRGVPGTDDYFDGLLSLMPHFNYVAAQRYSRNRPAGTIEAKPYNITADNLYAALTMEEGLIQCIEQEVLPHLDDTYKI